MADQPEKNKAIVRRWNEYLNTGNLGLYDELAAGNFASYGTTATATSLKELKAVMVAWRAAFPDSRITVDDIIAEGDKVAIRYTFRGTHKGPVYDIAPTGKQVTIRGMSFYRLVGGKIVEDWSAADGLGMLQQIGAVRQFG